MPRSARRSQSPCISGTVRVLFFSSASILNLPTVPHSTTRTPSILTTRCTVFMLERLQVSPQAASPLQRFLQHHPYRAVEAREMRTISSWQLIHTHKISPQRLVVSFSSPSAGDWTEWCSVNRRPAFASNSLTHIRSTKIESAPPKTFLDRYCSVPPTPIPPSLISHVQRSRRYSRDAP